MLSLPSRPPSERPRADILNIGFYDWDGRHLLAGGAERYISDLLPLIIDAGYRPRLLQNAREPFTREFNGVEVVGVVASPVFDLSKLAEAFAPMVTDAALVIASPVELAGRIAAGPTVIGINHGVWWDSPDTRAYQHDHSRHDTLLAALRRASVCVCVDTNFINWLRTFDGESLDRLQYIPNYVDTYQFRPCDKDFGAPRLTVLFPRRLREERGILQVFAVFEDLFKRDQPFDLHLCGGGEPADELRVQDFVARYPARARWTRATMEEMPSVYAASHIVLIPTMFSEGTSLACLEAMATRNGIVATHVGGLPNLVIDGLNGLLIKPGAAAMGAALCTLANDRGLLERLATRAVEVSECFSLDLWRSRWREILEGARRTLGTVEPDVCSVPIPSPESVPLHASMRPGCCGLVPGLVSVVLPVFNCVQLLESAIRSVLAQTGCRFELIIVNDGSTDGIETVLQRFSGLPNVRILTQPNLGLPCALTRGFARALGEFWTWTSADNLMERHQLQRMVAKLNREAELGMTYADYRVIDDRGNPLADRAWRWHNRPAPETGEVRLPRTTAPLNRISDNFIGPCFLYRGWIGRLLGDYDPAQGVEDYDYWMRMNALFSIRHLGTTELLYWYRVHANTLSANADEHSIVDKVSALMAREQERATYNSGPHLFDVEPAASAWMEGRGIVLEQGEYSERESAASTTTTCVALAGRGHDLLGEPQVGGPVPLVLIFSHGSASPYDVVSRLRQPGVLAVVSEARDAARIRALSLAPSVDGEAGNFPDAIQAFVRNTGFWQRTHTAVPIVEESAVPFVDVTGRHRLVLQVEVSANQGLDPELVALAGTLRKEGFEITILVLGSAAGRSRQATDPGFVVEMRDDIDTEDAYRSWLEASGVHLVNAHGSVLGASAVHALGIPLVQSLDREKHILAPEVSSRFRADNAARCVYAFDSVEAARDADFLLGLDPRQFRLIDNRIDGEVRGHGDRASAYARLFHALLHG